MWMFIKEIMADFVGICRIRILAAQHYHRKQSAASSSCSVEAHKLHQFHQWPTVVLFIS